MITQSQIDNDGEWIFRLETSLKIMHALEYGYWYSNYGKYLVKDIKERRLKNITQNEEIRKLESELINKINL